MKKKPTFKEIFEGYRKLKYCTICNKRLGTVTLGFIDTVQYCKNKKCKHVGLVTVSYLEKGESKR